MEGTMTMPMWVNVFIGIVAGLCLAINGFCIYWCAPYATLIVKKSCAFWCEMAAFASVYVALM